MSLVECILGLPYLPCVWLLTDGEPNVEAITYVKRARSIFSRRSLPIASGAIRVVIKLSILLRNFPRSLAKSLPSKRTGFDGSAALYAAWDRSAGRSPSMYSLISLPLLPCLLLHPAGSVTVVRWN